MADGGDIIIRGGSVDLEYDENVYPHDNGRPRNHRNNNKKIIRILVVDEQGVTQLDRSDNNGMKWEITAFTR